MMTQLSHSATFKHIRLSNLGKALLKKLILAKSLANLLTKDLKLPLKISGIESHRS